IISLIANPERYHNKRITTVGVARLEAEGHMLYLSPVDAERVNDFNGVWLEFGDEIRLPPSIQRRVAELNRHWVVVDGTFDMNDHGHLGFGTNGAIRKITRIDYLPDPTARDPATE